MSLLMILLTILLPPLPVAIKHGLGLQFLLNVLLNQHHPPFTHRIPRLNVRYHAIIP